MKDEILQVENRFYIATNSSYADNRILILNNSDTFGIFDRWGDILPFGEEVQGVYHEGTRFLSECEFRINNRRPTLLSSSIREENEILSVDLSTEAFPETEGKNPIAKGTLHIVRNKFVRNGSLHEMIEIKNFGDVKYDFTASLSFRADFKDIFEIRGMNRAKRGEVFEKKHSSEGKFRIRYLGLDKIERTTEVNLNPRTETWENLDRAIYSISLQPQERFMLEYSLSFGREKNLPSLFFSDAMREADEQLSESKKIFSNIFTSNSQFNHLLNRSRIDLLSLLAKTEDGYYPYAGVPWFNTAFGRDGIITAYETLWLAPTIARNVLLFLARNQATEINAYQNSEPGKILHELRRGEMVELNEIPFKRYYGSVDSTPLFIILAGAYFKRTNDKETIKKIWQNILNALNWMDTYGDLDGDGFLEYDAKHEHGLVNQGWKDSHDAIFDEEGVIKNPPIALCEVQAYAYGAKKAASELALLFGEQALSEKLISEAEALKKKFHEKFWDEKLGTYVMALDSEKKTCRVRSSNAGHALFTGIADKKIPEQLVKNLLSEDIYSGWGIRTISNLEKRFNPMSYHNGSVWPHDVAIIAHGFARYGFRTEAMKLMTGLFEAAMFIEHQRLPELFCGFTKRKGEGPTAYPVACSPQAWSVGAVFLLLEACLHIEINAAEKKVLFVKPFLPNYLDTILIPRFPLGTHSVSIELLRYKAGITLDVQDNLTDWEISIIK